MHDLAFADAARPTPATVLGIRLQPFTIGHEIRLLAERNALGCMADDDFAALPFDHQVYALKRAVLICSADWAGYESPVRRSRLSVLGFNLPFKLRLDRWVTCWGQLTRSADWPAEITAFRDYLAAGRKTIPALSAAIPEDAEAYEVANGGEKLGKGRSLGGPLLAQLLNFVGTRPHLFGLTTGRRPEDVPFAFALNLMLVHYEAEGGLFIENAREAQARAEMVEHRAAAKRERELAAQKEAESAAPQPNPTDAGT